MGLTHSRTARLVAGSAAVAGMALVLAGWRSVGDAAHVWDREAAIASVRADLAHHHDLAGRTIFRSVAFGQGDLRDLLCDHCRPNASAPAAAVDEALITAIAAQQPDYFSRLAVAVAKGDPVRIRATLQDGAALVALGSAEGQAANRSGAKLLDQVAGICDQQIVAVCGAQPAGAGLTTQLGTDVATRLTIETFRSAAVSPTAAAM